MALRVSARKLESDSSENRIVVPDLFTRMALPTKPWRTQNQSWKSSGVFLYSYQEGERGMKMGYRISERCGRCLSSLNDMSDCMRAVSDSVKLRCGYRDR